MGSIMVRQIAHSFLFLFISTSTLAQQNFWEPSNGPHGDAISDIVVNSSNHIFASNLDGNSIYFSVNGGEYWTITNNGLPSTHIPSIVINQYDILFAGTYEGLFRSTNNGEDWNEVFDKSITSMNIDNNDYIYVCDHYADPYYEFSTLYRSTDQGESWLSLLVEDGYYFTNVAINPNGVIFVCSFGFIYRYDNNWTLIDNVNRISKMAIHGNGNIFGGSQKFGMFRSTDNGDSWDLINNGLDTTHLLITSVSINENDVIFIGTAPNNLYSLTGKNYRSTDNGDNWIAIDSGLLGTVLHTIEFDSTNNIFGGTMMGVFFSSDNGNTWIHKSDGMRGVNFNSICTASNNNFFGVISGLPKLYKSSDNGVNWEIFTQDFPFSGFHSIAINQNDHFFAGIYDEDPGIQVGICRSTDNGTSWDVVLQGLSYTIKEIKIKQNGDIFAVADIGIFRSTNNGDNWVQVFSEWGPTSLDFNDDGHIFATCIGSGVYRSKDNGDNWIQINNGLTSSFFVQSL